MNKYLNTKYLLLLIIVLAALLRLYKLSANPPSLFGDELDVGYHAYSILKTGRDYQGNFMPLNFHSLAEWRTPLYLYSAVPTVAIFGITAFGVRLPAAIFGILNVLAIYLFIREIMNFRQKEQTNSSIPIIGAFLMAISPWSLQYSRAGFEVTEMLFFLLMGLYLFFYSLRKNGKNLWLGVFCLVLTPWIYSTAKLFTPFLFIFLFLLFKKEILSLAKSNLIKSMVAGAFIGIPLLYATFFAGGTQRFSDISIFTDPAFQSNIGDLREQQGRLRGETGAGLAPTLSDKIFFNKFTYWGSIFINNYLSAYSTQFLFIKGDQNPRQSAGNGEFYKIEIVALLAGISFLFLDKKVDKKIKLFIIFWFMAAPVPAALTEGGGTHATRLILLLPFFIFLYSYGWYRFLFLFNNYQRILFASAIGVLYLISLGFYLHNYYGQYIFESEHYWHYGWGPAISEIKAVDSNFDRVIISMSGEPAWIFFAGYYQYPPDKWQKNFPIGHDVNLEGFGKVSNIDKYYFGSPDDKVKLYGLADYIDSKTLYLANANEDGENLVLHPDKTPAGLKLIKAITYPSGEPAMYLFSGTKQ